MAMTGIEFFSPRAHSLGREGVLGRHLTNWSSSSTALASIVKKGIGAENATRGVTVAWRVVWN